MHKKMCQLHQRPNTTTSELWSPLVSGQSVRCPLWYGERSGANIKACDQSGLTGRTASPLRPVCLPSPARRRRLHGISWASPADRSADQCRRLLACFSICQLLLLISSSDWWGNSLIVTAVVPSLTQVNDTHHALSRTVTRNRGNRYVFFSF